MIASNYPTQFLNAGISIIPVKYRDKRPDASQLPRDADDKPTWEPFKTTLPSADDLHRWFAKPNNYGVICGWKNLLVLDFDDAGEYSKWRLWASRVGGQPRFIAENAFQVTTSRGVHVYLRCETPGANRKAGKIDIKYRGYVLGPGSVHPSGVIYRALKSALIFPLIHLLSDVLPGEILTLATPDNVRAPAIVRAADPWVSAMQTQPALGNGVVEKIKKTLRIEDNFIQKSQTSADGRWYITRCPLHDDHKPSFWIDTEQQICGCFSGCTPKPLDVIGLHARMYGLDNSEAIRVLASMVG